MKFSILMILFLWVALLSYESTKSLGAYNTGRWKFRAKSYAEKSAVVIEVDNVDETVAKCKENGFHCYRDDHLITHDGREGRSWDT